MRSAAHAELGALRSRPVTDDLAQPPRSVLAESVSATVEQVAAELGASCLVETRDGRVVAHCVVGRVPDAAITAVVTRTSLPLQAAVARRRTIRVSPGGGVQETELSGWTGRVLTSPLVAMGQPLGWLWVLLAPGRELQAEALAACTADVARAAVRAAVPDHSSLTACLLGTAGGQLPRPLEGVDQLWVVAIRSRDGSSGAVLSGMLDVALRAVSGMSLRCAIAAVGPRAYLVVGATATTAAETVLAAVDDLLSRSELVLQAGISDVVPEAGGLSKARIQADEALAVAGTSGRALPVGAARSQIVLRHLYRSLDRLPDLGVHPLAQLLHYDARNGGTLAPTLLTWLDAHGDRLLVAERLGVHVNTVGYRISRARTLLGLDLDDPCARLELHLRLRAALLDGGEL
jgi:hypothetical protein